MTKVDEETGEEVEEEVGLWVESPGVGVVGLGFVDVGDVLCYFSGGGL